MLIFYYFIPTFVLASNIGIVEDNLRQLNSCPDGSIIDSEGKYCCPDYCGQCGGEGCHNFPGGEYNCCWSTFQNSCDDGYAPCILSQILTDSTDNNEELSDQGSYQEENESELSDNRCTNGAYVVTLSGGYYCSYEACCPATCDECQISAYCDGPDECCIVDIYVNARTSDVDISCRDHDPPCLLPPLYDPCEDNPCQNGARCGYAYQSFGQAFICLDHVVCHCDEIGEFYGAYCEYECEAGETACGLENPGFSDYIAPNKFCCAPDEVCIRTYGKYGYSDDCYPNERPLTCDECLNGSSCQNQNYYGALFQCVCAEGYEGTYCENYVG